MATASAGGSAQIFINPSYDPCIPLEWMGFLAA